MLLDKKHLEKVLQSNWTTFLDKNIILSEVLKSIRDSDYPTIQVENLPIQKGIQLSLSRVEVNASGYIIWVDFSLPKVNNITTGTLELQISFDGQILHKESFGHLYALNTH